MEDEHGEDETWANDYTIMAQPKKNMEDQKLQKWCRGTPRSRALLNVAPPAHCDASESKIARGGQESQQPSPWKIWVPLRQPQLFDAGGISGSFLAWLNQADSRQS